MKDKKKIIIVITSCLLLVIGATFAYFIAQIGAGAKSNVDINAKTVDDLKFEVSKDINLSVDQFNFASGAGNLSDNAIAKASLRANATKNTATYNYYVYFNVSSNEFIYTTSDNKPEIVLTITDPNGAEITSIDGLTYVNATNADGTVVNGFDITTYEGLITVTDNHEISSNSSKNYTNQEWNFKVTFINLDTNQAANDSKLLTGEVLIQKNSVASVLADVCSSGDNLAGCIKTLRDKSFSNITNIYVHNASLKNGAGDGSYRYAGESHEDYYSCRYDGNDVWNYENYTLNQTLKGNCSKVYKIVSGNNTYYYDKSFEEYYYTTVSVKWDSANNKCLTSTDKTVLNWNNSSVTDESKCTGSAYQFKDQDYYYIGIAEVGAGEEKFAESANEVSNFVCFGYDSTDGTCPTDYLYRIIGVFDNEVKLIKYDYANSNLLGTDGGYTSNTYSKSSYSSYKGELTTINSYYWNLSGPNTWSASKLNTVNLNTNYLNNIGTNWSNKIATHTWKVGGNIDGNIVNATAPNAYTNEITNPSENTTYDANVGLMYASDYGYAAAPSAWNTTLYYYNDPSVTSVNWMYMGLYEWTITRRSDYSSGAFCVYHYGYVSRYTIGNGIAVRPVFYLTSSTTYVSGDGTMSKPFIIN